ncbi:osmotic avoidance abnormal protein 3-like [Amphibalanus amphitrite]|uniref:osmotic avoidance abnormal protein 3-like n=1 Tax=Amphibalanus amphitrite TaxID=1232801 RepID=UPI001C907EBF|nr:osmotic avoidance abnormal protein 3-like [Amphibalanus amphitrite]XP_043199003.1 osmotic avoidance abnormal protein 3-like [Amphibalanus amphitrite]
MAESVKVLVRCRPMNSREKGLNCEVVVFMEPSVMQVSIVNPADKNAPPKSFTFDGVYYMDSITENIYKDMAYPLVEGTLEGYNGTIFAYGQTGCGKSFSMQGIKDPPTQVGLIPRAFEHIFDVTSTSDESKFLVHGSYLEIYNEEIRDLLGVDSKKKIELKEHPEKGVYVQDLTKHPVANTKECEALMAKGWNNRSVGETLMNKDSSRSHSIFTIFIEMITPAKKPGAKDNIRAGKLNLVDLAGSERQGKTGATGDRLKEATKINLSLSALGNVISALVDGKSKHIPYRDSKLTRLLQDSLGGNTKTMMVACLSPADNNYDETVSTLRYANRAKQIKNKPKINEDPKDTLLREYAEEIKKLKEQLESAGGPAQVKLEKVVDEEAIQREREKLKAEYDQEMKKMKKELEKQQKAGGGSGPPDPAEVEKQAAKIRAEFEERERKMREELEAQKAMMSGGAIPQNVDPEVYEKLRVLQQQIVGGESANDQQAVMKRRKQNEEVQRRRKEIAAALGRSAAEDEDDDEILVKAYDDVQSTLRARTDLAKKMKSRLKAQEQEIRDIQREFAVERDDYLETIRRQEQGMRLLEQLLARVQPTIRKDCNYSDLEAIKKQAIWDEVEQKWRLPELQLQKTKLPPPVLGFGAPTTSTKYKGPGGTDWAQEETRISNRLERGAEENIAGSYFKHPTNTRQAEILFKTQLAAEQAAKQGQGYMDPAAYWTKSAPPSPTGSNHSFAPMGRGFQPDARKPARLAPVGGGGGKKNFMAAL